MKDEAKTRIDIDTLLQHCGFVLQDKGEFNRYVSMTLVFRNTMIELKLSKRGANLWKQDRQIF